MPARDQAQRRGADMLGLLIPALPSLLLGGLALRRLSGGRRLMDHRLFQCPSDASSLSQWIPHYWDALLGFFRSRFGCEETAADLAQ